MDIYCAVCGEPWDLWGANHGDMAAWEYDLFRKGAGCPCCQGECEHSEENMERHMVSAMMNSDDPDSFSLLMGGARPKWIRPNPKTLWECEHCGVRVVISLDCPYDGDQLPENIEDYLEWYGGRKVHYIGGSLPYAYSSIAREDPTKEPSHMLDGKSYCPRCACACSECGEVILIGSAAEGLSTYDSGHPNSNPINAFYGPVCDDCLYKLENW